MIDQRARALTVANERRMAACRFKRDLKTMAPTLAMRTVAAALVRGEHLGQVGSFVLAIPSMGPQRTRRLLFAANIKPMVKTRELSEIQRFRLSGKLRLLAQDREAYEARRDRPVERSVAG